MAFFVLRKLLKNCRALIVLLSRGHGAVQGDTVHLDDVILPISSNVRCGGLLLIFHQSFGFGARVGTTHDDTLICLPHPSPTSQIELHGRSENRRALVGKFTNFTEGFSVPTIA